MLRLFCCFGAGVKEVLRVRAAMGRRPRGSGENRLFAFVVGCGLPQ